MPSAHPDVARVVYASQSNLQHAVYAEMESIRASALRHNVPAGIHTALLFQSGWFVQWKEGPADAIAMLMARVERDPRHRGLRIVHSSRGPRLLSGPWSMAVVLADDSYVDMTERVMRAERRFQAGQQFSPPAVWRQLSTPQLHPGAAQQTDPEMFQRVTVCAAFGESSFEFVRWLGHRYREPVVHRRFAGDAGTDVGTDYVDFMDEERVVRMIAMARKGLTLPLTRAFLADDSHIVLLLSGDPKHDLPLVHRVAEACAGMQRPPSIIGVSEDPAAHAQMFGFAHCCGLIYLDACADPASPAAVWMATHPILERWREAANSSAISRPG